MNASLPESTSDGLDRLPPEPGHTRPDPCTDEHGRLKCVPINGVATSVMCLFAIYIHIAGQQAPRNGSVEMEWLFDDWGPS